MGVYPALPVTKAAFVEALGKPGVQTSVSGVQILPVKMSDAAAAVYTGLGLSSFGTMDQALTKLDLYPKGRMIDTTCLKSDSCTDIVTHQYVPNRLLTRAELANLLIRIEDFKLFR